MALVSSVAGAMCLISACSGRQAKRDSVPANSREQTPDIRIDLRQYGLPAGFFSAGADTKCASQIIGYRFVVWLGIEHVAVGFNTSPNCRQTPDRKVDGLARILVFDIHGKLQAQRDLPYLADGNGELVTDGEAGPGPKSTLLFRMESVSLDPEGRNESKSGVRLLDRNLKDVRELDQFLEQATLVDHALVFQEGFTLNGPRTYSLMDGAPPVQVRKWTQDWPAGTMDRKFGEHGVAFMVCGQELRPGEYTSTSVIHGGAKFRCALNAQSEDGSTWSLPMEDGETAALVGLLADGSVVGQIHTSGGDTERLIVWRKDGHSESLPWLPTKYEGTVDSAARDFSRYASFATHDAKWCNPIARVLGTACDERGEGRWFVFDRGSKALLVDRAFPKNGRAALAPDGLHYVSFESNELRIFSVPEKP
jgi:hypothetical protein